jgi:hypothetical protein
MARFWQILASTAVLAFLLSGLLAALSLLLKGIGLVSGQIVLGGLAEVLFSYVFLIAGMGILYAAARAIRRSSEPGIERIVFVVAGMFCGVCWVIIGIRGVFSSETLMLFFRN